MKKFLIPVIILFLSIVFSINFQSCSKVDFSKSTSPSPTNGGLGTPTDPEGVVPRTGNPEDPGLLGGHFDLDTSKLVYPFGSGTTTNHVHEFDDKFNVNYADFFNLPEADFDEVDESVAASDEFIIIVGNAALSPGGILEINGQKFSVVDYEKLPRRTFSLDGHAGTEKLTSLKTIFAFDAIQKGSLIPTATGCVRRNDPGPNMEYRNGALTIQILNKAQAKIDPLTLTATIDGGLMWEATIFWHRDSDCY